MLKILPVTVVSHVHYGFFPELGLVTQLLLPTCPLIYLEFNLGGILAASIIARGQWSRKKGALGLNALQAPISKLH